MELPNKDPNILQIQEGVRKKVCFSCVEWLRKQVTSDKSTAHYLNYLTLKISEPSI